MDTDAVEISIVTAAYNEAGSLQELYERVTKTLESLGEPYEVIVVDDGSTDNSPALLRALREQDKRWRVVRLARNFGQSPALYAGFSLVRGRCIVMIDADLQVYPEDIPLLVEKIKEGYDMVSGWRVNRRDGFFRRVMSRLLNRYTAYVTGLPLHDYGCSLKGFSRPMIERMTAFTHRCRYLAVDAAMLGGDVTEVPVRHQLRPHGRSKYGLFKLFRTAFDLITAITIMPLQFFSMVGVLFSFVGFAMSARVLYYRLVYGNILALETVIAAFFFLAGVQLFATGLMCEYVGRIYIEAQRKPLFVIKEELE
ncbi:MAG TPA: glycosyltransferase [Candidatus Hydrogenedentes bacterium]|nr:glycosyltransferase [Candidatus Hydrogenedentota bacterium]